jgi:hypothetical protein
MCLVMLYLQDIPVKDEMVVGAFQFGGGNGGDGRGAAGQTA